MRVIKRRIMVLTILTGLCLSIVVLSVFFWEQETFESGKVLLWAVFLCGVLGIAGTSAAAAKMSQADLIVKNQIMHIQTVVLEQLMAGGKVSREGFQRSRMIDISISCFGILLDTRVIPFNQNGIRLNSIVLTNDCISVAYEKKQKTFRIRILHKWMDRKELDEVAEKFRYETGVSAIIQEKKQGTE